MVDLDNSLQESSPESQLAHFACSWIEKVDKAGVAVPVYQIRVTVASFSSQSKSWFLELPNLPYTGLAVQKHLGVAKLHMSCQAK